MSERAEGHGGRVERIRQAAAARMDEMTGALPYGGPQEFRLTTAEVAKFVALMDAYRNEGATAAAMRRSDD